MDMDINQQAQADFRAYCSDLDYRRGVFIDRVVMLTLALSGTFIVMACLL